MIDKNIETGFGGYGVEKKLGAKNELNLAIFFSLNYNIFLILLIIIAYDDFVMVLLVIELKNNICSKLGYIN